jgi:hypothetical protein
MFFFLKFTCLSKKIKIIDFFYFWFPPVGWKNKSIPLRHGNAAREGKKDAQSSYTEPSFIAYTAERFLESPFHPLDMAVPHCYCIVER